MAALASAALISGSASITASSCCSNRTFLAATKTKKEKKRQLEGRASEDFGKFGQFVEVVKTDFKFIKNGFSSGVGWTNEALRIPQLLKAMNDLIWLKHLEDPSAAPFLLLAWPQPYYPELSGVDLFLADLKALEAYAVYFYSVSKMWANPLPEVYDPQEVSEYFSRRPHVVALRLLKVILSFASAAIRIRAAGMKKLYKSSADNNISQYEFGLVLKETMLNLGPTFIKVGQSLSTRPDITGSEISKALSGLHDQIPPFPRDLAMKIIEEELGSPVDTFFSYISKEPIAAASFGQVYRARTLDGYDVALKVQRPNLHHVVVRDIYILRLGLGLLQKLAKRKSDPRLYADELGKGLVGELDYNLEAVNASEFKEVHSSYPFIHVPRVFRHLTRKRVLTMEWMAGENPRDLILISSKELVDRSSTYSEKQQNEAKSHLLDLVNKGVEATLIQLLDTGLLHADPHPGNLRYTSSGKLGFLDFGLLCRMEKKHQFAMLASILHIVYGDWASLVHALTEMDIVRPGTSLWRVTMDLEDALGEVEFKDGIPNIKFSRVLGKIWSVALKYHFRMPPYYTLVLRSLASLEGLAVAADPNFKTFEAAYPYVVHKLLTDNSAANRKILHSVVFNRRKEFQWQKLSLFLRMGATRKGLQTMMALSSETSIDHPASGVFNVANLVLGLLPSKDGVVLRRLLMSANGASLVQAMLSKEAIFFRQQICTVIADMLYHRIAEFLGTTVILTQYGSQMRLKSNGIDLVASSKASKPINNYLSIIRDRRLKMIFFKILRSARKDPILMLRFYWASFLIFVTASALACHRVLVSFSEAYLNRISFAPKRFAVSG